VSSLALLSDLEQTGALTPISLRLPRDVTRDEYEALGALLGRIHETVRFAIGDFILEGESRFEHDAAQLQECLGISHDSKMQYVRVAQAIPIERRRTELTWSHHRAVAPLPPDEQDHWLNEAVTHGWTKGILDTHLRPEAIEAWKPDSALVLEAARNVYAGAHFDGDSAAVAASLMRRLGDTLGIVEA
jgi:hypothetical protein